MTSATIEDSVDMGEKVIINIKTFAGGHKAPARVIPAMFWRGLEARIDCDSSVAIDLLKNGLAFPVL